MNQKELNMNIKDSQEYPRTDVREKHNEFYYHLDRKMGKYKNSKGKVENILYNHYNNLIKKICENPIVHSALHIYINTSEMDKEDFYVLVISELLNLQKEQQEQMEKMIMNNTNPIKSV